MNELVNSYSRVDSCARMLFDRHPIGHCLIAMVIKICLIGWGRAYYNRIIALSISIQRTIEFGNM